MMKRIIIQAEQDLLDRARERAVERGVSLAQVFREALERDLGEAAPPPPLLSLGIGSSDRGDLSRRASDGEFVPRPSHS